jgi:hypothetical protein
MHVPKHKYITTHHQCIYTVNEEQGKMIYKQTICPACGGKKTVIDITKPCDCQPCLWDSMPETYPGSGVKVGHLSCPCPKCTPRY